MFLILTLLTALFTSPQAQAAKFTNQFVEFELPPKWQCNLEGADWVCQSADSSKKRDAIIILAAKLKGDQDSLDQYLAYLKRPKMYTSVDGKAVKSDVKYAKNNQFNEHPWIDSLHLESEVPGFYTRYLATVKQDIGVLVTYSINKNKYQQYLNEFENMVKTLRVFRKSGGLNAGSGSLFSNTNTQARLDSNSVFPNLPPQPDAPKPAPKKADDSTLYLLIGAAAVGFIIWRKRRGGG